MSILARKKRAKCIVAMLKKLYPKLDSFLNYAKPHELLFAVIMSAQTTDKQVNVVTKNLFKKYPDLENYASVSVELLAQDIRSIGLYKTKAKHIVEAAKILFETYKGTIPDSMEELLMLPGVARKTANVVLGKLYGRAQGIAVDTHVIRLSQLYGLTSEKDAKRIEQDLMKIISQNEWIDFTNRMIQYGRDFCPAKIHNHTKCPLLACLNQNVQ